MSRLISAAKTRGEHVLDDPFLQWDGTEEFVDPRDCRLAMIAAVDADDPAQGGCAIAHPKGWTLDAVVAEVASRFRAFALNVPDHRPSGFAGFPHLRPAPTDLAAAATEMGFEAKHDLADTLERWCRTARPATRLLASLIRSYRQRRHRSCSFIGSPTGGLGNTAFAARPNWVSFSLAL